MKKIFEQTLQKEDIQMTNKSTVKCSISVATTTVVIALNILSNGQIKMTDCDKCWRRYGDWNACALLVRTKIGTSNRKLFDNFLQSKTQFPHNQQFHA